MKSRVPIWYCVMLIVLVSIFSFVLLEDKDFLLDSDIFWHLSIGEWITENQQIPDKAIGSYASESIDYVPHEWLYQLTVYISYDWFGWWGLYGLAVLGFAFFMWGTYRLTELSRKEAGLSPHHPTVHLFLIFYFIIMFFSYTYFKVFSLSMTLVVWFLVWLKRFMAQPNFLHTVILSFLSLLMANFHGGTWVVLFVFFGFACLDALFSKQLTKWHVISFFGILGFGLLNPDGMRTLTYAWTVGDYKVYLANFKPLSFDFLSTHFWLLVLFLAASHHTLSKGWFEKFLVLGVLFLGLSSGYQFLYLMICLPYVVAVALGKWDKLPTFFHLPLTRFAVFLSLSVGIILTILSAPKDGKDLISPVAYPVDEWAYIASSHTSLSKPRILAEYEPSGYLVHQGALVLADARFDPYLTKETTGIYGWNAFERQRFAFDYGFLYEESLHAPPDYIVVPKSSSNSTSKTSPFTLLQQKDVSRLGKPVFEGRYGYVYKWEETNR